MDFKLITVPIADYKISKSPNILRTILGSCVGVCLYDKEKKIGGLSHIMLPVYNSENNANPKKYADSAIEMLFDDMLDEGCKAENMIAKIAGGASMFKMPETSFIGSIGSENVKKVKEVLSNYNIPIVAEDVLGDYGRTLDFILETGEVKIKSLGKPEKII